MIRILGVLIAVFMFPLLVTAEDEWRILTDYRNVNDLEIAENSIWCATDGGLAEFDLSTEQFRTYSVKDGMGGIGVSTLEIDAEGGIWVAFSNLVLQRFDPVEGVTHTVSAMAQDNRLSKVNQLTIDSLGIFVATNRGIANIQYSERYDRWIWFEEYSHFGEMMPGQEVNDVLVKDHYIWVATDVGIARGDLDTPAPLEWDVYTMLHGLPDDEVYDLIEYDNKIIAATANGVSSWDGLSWRVISNNRRIRRLVLANDSLKAVGTDGIHFWDGNGFRMEGEPRRWISSATYEPDGTAWAGVLRVGIYAGGLARQNAEGWEDFTPEGPASNYIYATAFMADGSALLVGGRQGGEYGLSRWDGLEWRIVTAPEGVGTVFHYQHRDVLVDYADGVWVGTFGGGIARYNPDDSIVVYNHSEESGSRLKGYGVGNEESVVLAPALESDSKGNIWVLNRGAVTRQVLVCIPQDFITNPDPERNWYYYDRSLFNNYEHFDVLAVDSRDRKWIAATSPEIRAGQGVYVFDDNGTLDDTDDDQVSGPITGLNTAQVLCMTWDPQGYMWVGTIDGAYYINADVNDPGSQSFTQLYQLRDVQVNTIAIDPSGNAWFGSIFGVTVIAPDLYTTVRNITSEPPDILPSERVSTIGINPYTGWAYIGTEEGTVALRTPYRDYGDKVESVSVEPNPFNPNQGLMVFTGNSLAAGGEARIYTPNGKLVRSMTHDEAAIGWDGLNESGHKVASGVYLILVYSPDGSSAKGKVAVIWK